MDEDTLTLFDLIINLASDDISNEAYNTCSSFNIKFFFIIILSEAISYKPSG